MFHRTIARDPRESQKRGFSSGAPLGRCAAKVDAWPCRELSTTTKLHHVRPSPYSTTVSCPAIADVDSTNKAVLIATIQGLPLHNLNLSAFASITSNGWRSTEFDNFPIDNGSQRPMLKADHSCPSRSSIKLCNPCCSDCSRARCS